jgi:hypothetical protein
MRRETQGLPPHDAPMALVVEPRGDRFVIVDGHYLYATYEALNQAVVKCHVGPAVHSCVEDGTLENLRAASLELCKQLELETVVVSASRIDGRGDERSRPAASLRRYSVPL